MAQAKRWRLSGLLRAAISDGTYAPGQKLPQTSELSKQHGVSGNTITDATGLLQRAGILVLRKGEGLFVNDFPIFVQEETRRLSASVWADGRAITDADQRDVSIDMIAQRRAAPPQRIAEYLGLEQGVEAATRSRRQIVDGRPVNYSTSYIPLDIAEDTVLETADTGPGGTPARLADLGHRPTEVFADLDADVADGFLAEALAVPVGTALAVETRGMANEDGRIVEVTVKSIPAGRGRLRFRWPL